MDEVRPLDPANTMLVIKTPAGKEVGRIAVTAPNATDYLAELARYYGDLNLDYVEDAMQAQLSALFNTRR